MFRRTTIIGLALLILAVFGAGCFTGNDPERADEVSGKILLWHAWNEAEEIVLEQILERFMQINSDATVKIQGFDSADEMLAEFETAASSGLGPDLMIAPSDAARVLVAADLIRSIDDEFSVEELSEDEAGRFLRTAVQAMEVDGSLYGLPASLSTNVLYYNKDLVDAVPITLSGLVEEAAAGRSVAMSDSFLDAFWGIQAFGGKLFDDEGRLAIDRGGFVNWLAWLKTARDLPGVLLDPDSTALQERFLDGDAVYYVGNSQDMQTLAAQLGDDVLGVASLPGGPIGLAGPLLGVEGLLFSSASSERQRDLAVELAKFLTNPEQSALLMREVQHIPANLGLNINPSLMPMMNTLSIQARNSIILADTDEANSILDTVISSYDRMLEGLLDPAQASADITAAVNAELGFEETNLSESTCESIGVLRVANLLPAGQGATIDERLREYRNQCPNVVIRSAAMDIDELYATFAGESSVLGYADLIIGPQTVLSSLVDDGHIRKTANLLTSDERQRFQPKALDAMRYDSEIFGDGIYGFPLFSDVNALYYHRDLVADPALNLIDFETQAADGVPIVLEADLANGFWGFGAMGGVITPGDSLSEQNEAALSAWLTWLRDMRDGRTIDIVDDHQLARQKFLDQESVYYVGAASEYADLLSMADSSSLATSLLPAGPGGAASPLLLTYGIMVNSATTDARAVLISDLVRYLTDPATAEQLAANDNVVPANAAIDLSLHPDRVAFSQQALTAAVLPNTPGLAELVASFDGLFDAVLKNNVQPEEAVAELFGQMSASEADAPDSVDPAASEESESAGTATP